MLGLLRELVAGQREIIRLLSNSANAQSLPAPLSRADRARLKRALPAITGVHGSKKLSSRELAEDTAPAVRLVLRGLSSKAISKLFTRAAGIPIDGLMVRQAGTEFRVALWQVVAVPGSFKLPETLHEPDASGSIEVGEPDA